MNPIEKLKAEHKIILRGIDLLENGAARLNKGDSIPPDYFRKAIDFIRNYADRYHHAKEEDILFIRMGQLGFSAEMGPVAVMLNEHDQGRALITDLEQANEKYASGDTGAIKDIAASARDYATLLRLHIHKEDLVLYPMAQKALGDEGITEMQADFNKVEKEKAGTEQKYLNLLAELEKA